MPTCRNMFGHAEGPRLVGHHRHHARTQLASFMSVPNMRTIAMVVDISLPAASIANWPQVVIDGTDQPLRRHSPPSGQIASEACASRVQVLHLRTVFRGFIELDCLDSASDSGKRKRSRNALRSSKPSFFCWCVVILPWPDVPMPKPFIVLARITVGWPRARAPWRRPRGVCARRDRRGAGCLCLRR